MPRVKYREFIEKLRNSSVFSWKQVETKMGKNYAKVWIHNMLERGEIIKLFKGWYTFKHSPYLITIALGKAYVGLGTAAFLHGVWNQVPNICILSPNASSKIRGGERIVAGEKVIIKKISEKMYFGYEEKYFEDKDIKEWIRVSDPEKTLIDIVYYNYASADEILPELVRIVDIKKLEEYLKLIEKRKIRGWKRVTSSLTYLIR